MYGIRKQIIPTLTVLVMVGLILLVPFLPASEAKRTLKDVELEEDSYKSYLLISSMDDEVEVNFTVTSGGNVDLYIMTSEMYRDRYQQDLHFNPAMVRENITTARFTWTQPDDSTYYLVIDNWDNGRTTDAKPTGNVTYDLFYDDGFLDDLDELFGMAMMMVVGCCLLVIIVVVVVIWLLFRKKKDNQGTVVIPPPVAYPPGGQPSYPGAPPSYPQSPQPPYQPPPGFNQQPQQQPPYPQPPVFPQPPPPNYPPPQQQPPYQQSPGYPYPPPQQQEPPRKPPEY